jgi:hypothetical protein
MVSYVPARKLLTVVAVAAVALVGVVVVVIHSRSQRSRTTYGWACYVNEPTCNVVLERNSDQRASKDEIATMVRLGLAHASAHVGTAGKLRIDFQTRDGRAGGKITCPLGLDKHLPAEQLLQPCTVDGYSQGN